MWNHSGGSIRLGFGYAILRNDTLLAPVYVYTSGNMSSAGWYGTVTYSGSVNVTVLDDDIIIPVWGAYSSNVTTWNMSSSITTWKLEGGHPVLNSWDFTANRLDFYPTTQRTNSLISADGVLTMKSASVQVDGDLRVLGARTHFASNDNDFYGAFSGANPYVQFDAHCYMLYDRTAKRYQINAGSKKTVTIEPSVLTVMNDVGSSNLPNLNLYGNGGPGNTLSINMSPWSSRTRGAAVRICAVDAGNADAYFSLQVATGGTDVVATEVMRATQQLITFTPPITNKNWMYFQGGAG